MNGRVRGDSFRREVIGARGIATITEPPYSVQGLKLT